MKNSHHTPSNHRRHHAGHAHSRSQRTDSAYSSSEHMPSEQAPQRSSARSSRQRTASARAQARHSARSADASARAQARHSARSADASARAQARHSARSADARAGAPYQDGAGQAFSQAQARSNSQGGRRASEFNFAPKKPRRRKLAIVLLSLLLVFSCVGAAGAWYYFDVSDSLHRGLDKNLDGVLAKTDLNKEPFYMLLMGTDRSKERDEDSSTGNTYRSDSMMLVRIDPVDKKITLVSLHRDTLMDMGKAGRQKLNAAYSLGGASYTVKTVSKLAGVPISHYAEINFDGFKDVIDALGGVTVDVPIEIDDADAGGHLDRGVQNLTGDQALILCRARHAYDEFGDGDLYRAANQRLVMQAIAKKILSADPGTMANTIKALSRYITTDLEIGDILGLAQHMRGVDLSTNLYSAMEPTTPRYIEGDGWYEYCDEKAWKAMMKRVDQGLPPVEKDQVDASGTIMAQTGAQEGAASKKETDSLQ